MTDDAVLENTPSETAAPPPLTQLQRITNTFIAPQKTFHDINRSAAWWLPFLIIVVIGTANAFITLRNANFDDLTKAAIARSPRLAERLADDPQAYATFRSTYQRGRIIGLYAEPLSALINGLIVAALFLGTVKFIFGDDTSYAQMLAVWFYGTLPMRLHALLSLCYRAIHPAISFLPARNPLNGTNIGFYLHPGSVPMPLMRVLSAIDLFSLWIAVLLTIGVSITARMKRRNAAIIVFGWWGLSILLAVAGAALMHKLHPPA